MAKQIDQTLRTTVPATTLPSATQQISNNDIIHQPSLYIPDLYTVHCNVDDTLFDMTVESQTPKGARIYAMCQLLTKYPKAFHITVTVNGRTDTVNNFKNKKFI